MQVETGQCRWKWVSAGGSGSVQVRLSSCRQAERKGGWGGGESWSVEQKGGRESVHTLLNGVGGLQVGPIEATGECRWAWVDMGGHGWMQVACSLQLWMGVNECGWAQMSAGGHE